MKTSILTGVLLFCSLLNAVDLINQTFPGMLLPPTWTKTGPSTVNWGWSNTTNAGGTAGELNFISTPTNTGTFRFISPAFDTRKVHDMHLSFRHMLDDRATEFSNYTLGVQISTDLINWTNCWSVTTSSDIAATTVNADISFELGKSQTTYIAFFFTGNSFQLDNWYVDDILLTYTNTLGIGIWPGGDSYPVGDLIVPVGYNLQIPPGAALYFESYARLYVRGSLYSNGTESLPVILTASDTTSGWTGVYIQDVIGTNDSTIVNYTEINYSNSSGACILNSDKVRLSHCRFKFNESDYPGSAIFISYSDIVVDDCLFESNYSEESIIYCRYSSPVFRYNQILHNTHDLGGYTVRLENTNVSGFRNNKIVSNYNPEGHYNISFSACNGVFAYNLIANNDGSGIYVFQSDLEVRNCIIANNAAMGIGFNSDLLLRNSVVWGQLIQLNNNGSSAGLDIIYNCIEDGVSGISGDIDSIDYHNNVSGNPMFMSPTAGTGSGYDALAADWTLQSSSPCLDAGDPSLPWDPDSTISDIGLFSLALRPLITVAADVPDDQGHQLVLKWNRTDADKTYDYYAFYSVWREGISRSEGAVYVSDLSQITPGMRPAEDTIYWRDGDRTWCYINQIPAVTDLEYEYIVPTLQDSSSSGTHAVSYMVRFHNRSGVWSSLPISGYSVDNIPPLPPARLDLSQFSSSIYFLTWEEVIAGIWEGNLEEEINPITYKVYAGDSCDFIPGPDNYLTSTTYPSAVMIGQTADHKFYKVIASDSE
jgi:hypothetical protein